MITGYEKGTLNQRQRDQIIAIFANIRSNPNQSKYVLSMLNEECDENSMNWTTAIGHLVRFYRNSLMTNNANTQNMQ